MTWAKIVSALVGLVKPLLAWIVYTAGKRAARREIEAEQNAVNAKALEKDVEIEMQDRSDGPWIKG